MTEIELALNHVQELLNQVDYHGILAISCSDKLIWVETRFARENNEKLEKVGFRPSNNKNFGSLRHKAMNSEMTAFYF